MNTKTCISCRKEKSLDEFYNNKSTKDGKQSYCIECWSTRYKIKRNEAREAALELSGADPRFLDFAKVVLNGRDRLKMTQEQFGTALGVSGTAVRLWEKAKTIPRQETIVNICQLLNIEVPVSARRGAYGHIPLGVGKCNICGVDFPIYKKGVLQCSRSCGAVVRNKLMAVPVGSKGSGGSGYAKIKTENGWQLEHRAVMEKELGRALEPHERVHHKNGNRSDNRVENLELWKGKTKKDPAGVRASDYHCAGCLCGK